MSFLFCFALSEEAELVEMAEAGSLLGEAAAQGSKHQLQTHEFNVKDQLRFKRSLILVPRDATPDSSNAGSHKGQLQQQAELVDAAAVAGILPRVERACTAADLGKDTPAAEAAYSLTEGLGAPDYRLSNAWWVGHQIVHEDHSGWAAYSHYCFWTLGLSLCDPDAAVAVGVGLAARFQTGAEAPLACSVSGFQLAELGLAAQQSCQTLACLLEDLHNGDPNS
ncbi:MAG: hypothetical protein FRX49_11284 [Trebouxia sp. A1-2]|nr:MAG: hypothetical protein FRX49_11284 [Trebouxia sp. A1-2]